MILRPFTALRLSAELKELSFSFTVQHEPFIVRSIVTVVSKRGRYHIEKSLFLHVLLFLLSTISEMFYITISYLEKKSSFL